MDSVDSVDKDVVNDIRQHLTNCFNQMPVVEELMSGALSRRRMRELALLHYAETKTFINIKNPARMYLCPHEARHAKRYFCYLYEEEQGNFRQGENHADLFKALCYELDLTDELLECCYERYARSWLYLFHEKPSMEVMVRELGVSVAWESFTPFFGPKLIDGLKGYEFSEQALVYFKVHNEVDVAHSARAIDTLARYCITDELMSIAKKAISTSLIDELHLVQPYESMFRNLN